MFIFQAKKSNFLLQKYCYSPTPMVKKIYILISFYFQSLFFSFSSLCLSLRKKGEITASDYFISIPRKISWGNKNSFKNSTKRSLFLKVIFLVKNNFLFMKWTHMYVFSWVQVTHWMLSQMKKDLYLWTVNTPCICNCDASRSSKLPL